jgi:hypothetical protein
VKDQVSFPYKIRHLQILFVSFNLYIFYVANRKTKEPEPHGSKHRSISFCF